MNLNIEWLKEQVNGSNKLLCLNNSVTATNNAVIVQNNLLLAIAETLDNLSRGTPQILWRELKEFGPYTFDKDALFEWTLDLTESYRPLRVPAGTYGASELAKLLDELNWNMMDEEDLDYDVVVFSDQNNRLTISTKQCYPITTRFELRYHLDNQVLS